MNQEIQTVWTAHTTEDEHGRNAELLGIFSTEEAAKGAASKKGWYGGDGNVEKRKGLLVGDGEALLIDRVIHYPVSLDTNLVQQRAAKLSDALAKLTAEEIDLLGIKVW